MEKYDFLELRERIEKLAEQINKSIDAQSIYDSSENLDKAKKMWIQLRNIAENDVQERAVSRLSDNIEYLATRIDNIFSKREAGKQGDGNIALKCNWNDKGYKNPCSKVAYQHNIEEGRAWCNSPSCKC
ncbi:MAG: hypothetical protein ACTSYY_11590 [Promethearchaeota archaeon]